MSTSGSSATSAARGSLEMGVSDQELLNKPGKRWTRKNILIAGGAAIALIALILILVFTVGQGNDGNQPLPSADPKPGFELNDYLQGRFAAARFNGSWITDTQFMFRDVEGRVMLHDVFSGTSESLVTPAEVPLLNESFIQQLSADRKFLLLGYAYEKLFRHSYYANYSVVNLDTKLSSELVGPDNSRRLQLVKWAPVGNGLVFVHDNDIYYKPGADDSSMHIITSSGEPNNVYNGVPDWVYEEEVFGSNEALWFSPDGNFLAYATLDDTNVRNMSFPYYGAPSNFVFQYTFNINIKYPKPGTPNPTVKLNLIDLTKTKVGDGKSVRVAPPTEVGDDHILAAVTWSKTNEVSAVWMNRIQNMFIIQAQQTEETAVPEKVLTRMESNGWVDLFEAPHFSADGTKMLFVVPQPQEGDVGDYRHLTLVTRRTGSDPLVTPLTKGQFVVTSIAAWDEPTGLVYFLANSEKDPAQQNLYSIRDDASSSVATCLSCGVKVEDTRKPCTYVSASFSTEHSYYILSCNGPDVPGAIIFKKDGESVRVWEDNSKLAAFMAAHSAPSRKRQFVDVPGNMRAYTQLLLPPDMDMSGNTKYPMLVNVYGGPDSSQVSDRWVGDWGTYLTTNRSIIYAAIDGRGSGLKGNNMLFSGYKNLGSVEIEDQIEVTRSLQELFPYIDKERTAIWGWSYGGYSTGMALAKDLTGVFRCGMSVAPVTDWIYYDSIYTERYMLLPTVDDNLAGYARANLNNETLVANLGRNDNRFLLVHGNADDNVHYQQAMILSRVLEKKDILFTQQSYPDEAHGLNGVTPHLYHTLEKFLDVCLDLPERKLRVKNI